MKECFLQFDAESGPQEYQVKASGYSHIAPGEYEARGTWPKRRNGWQRVRIGEVLDHLGGAQNRGGAVYAATLLRDYPPEATDTTGELFGGKAE